MQRSGYLERRTSLRTKTSIRRGLKNKRISEAQLKRDYGITSKYDLRWKGLKGIYWYYFSRFVRMRDFILYRKCISCNGHVDDWKNADAGHYVAVSHCGFSLLFHEKAVNLQHKHCNNPVWNPDAGAGYSHGLDKRYGEGTAKKLWAMKNKVGKAWVDLEYVREIEVIRNKVTELETQL